MTTPGTYIYNATANDIIIEALSLVGVYAPGEALPDSETADALRTLNLMLKAWMPRHGIWLNRELFLFLQDATLSYSIGPTGDHCARNGVKTELASAAASGATSITIDATTGFGDTFDRNGIVTAVTPAGAGSITLNGALVTNGIAVLSSDRKILIYSTGNESARLFSVTGQNTLGAAVTEDITGPNATTVYSSNSFKTISAITIDGAGTGSIEIGQVGDPVGVELDGGAVHWTYIAGALSTIPSLVTALTGAAAVDNHVYSYAARTPRPIEIIEARLHMANDYERPLWITGKNEYQLLSNKTSPGSPNQVYYDKQLNNGTLYTWPVCDNVQEYIRFSARLPIQNLDNLTDDFEVAQEWFEAIAWNLAIRLFPKYGKPIDALVKLQAEEFLESVKDSDSENSSIFIQIGNRRV